MTEANEGNTIAAAEPYTSFSEESEGKKESPLHNYISHRDCANEDSNRDETKWAQLAKYEFAWRDVEVRWDGTPYHERKELWSARALNASALQETFQGSILEWDVRMEMFGGCHGMVMTEEPGDDTVQVVFRDVLVIAWVPRAALSWIEDEQLEEEAAWKPAADSAGAGGFPAARRSPTGTGEKERKPQQKNCESTSQKNLKK